MGFFGFNKSKKNVNSQFNKDVSIIYDMIDRKKRLILEGEVKDNYDSKIETEKFVINLYKGGVFLNLLGFCSIDNINGDYEENENGKVLAKDIVFKIINSNNLQHFKDDIFYIHTYLDFLLNKN